MNRKLLFAATRLTCAVLLSTADGFAIVGNTGQPQADHPAMMLDSGLWRSEFLTRTGETQTNDSDAVPSAQTDSHLSGSSRATTLERASDSSVPAQGPNDGMCIDLPPVDVAEVMQLASSTDQYGPGHDAESAEDDSTLSDCQLAVAVSVGKKGKALTSNGPSVISLIVGVMGLIVVVGAYMTGGKKKQ